MDNNQLFKAEISNNIRPYKFKLSDHQNRQKTKTKLGLMFLNKDQQSNPTITKCPAYAILLFINSWIEQKPWCKNFNNSILEETNQLQPITLTTQTVHLELAWRDSYTLWTSDNLK